MPRCVLHLGSNIGNRLKNIQAALEYIEESIGDIIDTSNTYNTEPWGFKQQNPFYNAAITIDTNYSPSDLLKELQKIEIKLGRIKKERWQERIIDIDIIFYENRIINSEKLKIPHPYYTERKFVLVTLKDIIPHFKDPVSNWQIKDLYTMCDDESLVQIVHHKKRP